MQNKHLATLAAVLALSLGATAADLDSNDVPNECRDICQPVVDWSNTCDNNTRRMLARSPRKGHSDSDSDNDQDERDCICNKPGADSIIPLCEACIEQYDRDDNDDDDENDNERDNDANDMLRLCSFSTTSYNPTAATSAISSATGSSSASPSATTGGASASPTDGAAAETPSPTDGGASGLSAPQTGLVGSALIAFLAAIGA